MVEFFKNRMTRLGNSQYGAYNKNADIAIDNTFKNDPRYKEIFITHAPSNMFNVAYDAKFSIHTRRSMSGDTEDYFLMFRPHVDVPIGSYADIENNNGVLERWLVVLRDDKPQFPTYFILKCNWVLKWKLKDIVYRCECVQRTQSSYNSGLWTDYVTTTVENQTIMMLPTTPYTQKLNYDQRVLINDNGRDIPIAWKVSKVMDTIPKGITRLTFAQEVANMQEDCGKYGIANWCTCNCTTRPYDCISCTIAEPIYVEAGLQMPTVEEPHAKITYNGKDSSLRVGGSAKTFTVQFWDAETSQFTNDNPMWTLSFMNGTDLLCSIKVQYINNHWYIVEAPNNPSGIEMTFEVISGTKYKIVCNDGINDIFRINVEPVTDNSMKLKCEQLYSMVGKTIKFEAINARNNTADPIYMEVIS